MVKACGLKLRRKTSFFTMQVLTPANEVLFEGTMAGIKRWLRKTGRVA